MRSCGSPTGSAATNASSSSTPACPRLDDRIARDGVTIDDGQHELRYITAELLQVQAQALNGWARGRRCGAGVVQRPALERALADNPQLNAEQVALVTRWCTSGDRVQAAVGRAGTGKTTTMRVAADAWRNAGYRVIGAAVKGEAARQLAADAGIDADTVALLLTHCPPRHPDPRPEHGVDRRRGLHCR